MTLQFRKSFGNIELLRVNGDPNGISATIGSIAKNSQNGKVYRNIGGSSWSLITSAGAGPAGEGGSQGYSGTPGPQGFQGPVGPQGPQGSYGWPGDPGQVGYQGHLGPQGQQGYQGPNGSQGVIGSLGAAGNAGAQGSSGSGGSSALILLGSDYKASAGQYVDFSSLNGDSDRIYVIKQRLIKANNGVNYSYNILPNGVSTNFMSQWVIPYYVVSTAAAAMSFGSENSNLYHSSAGLDTVQFTMTIYAEKSTRRFILMEYQRHSATHYAHSYYGFVWNETSTNLTSIRLAASAAPGFAVGTETHLYKLVV